MTRVFLDTVGILAIWDRDDQWHRPAAAAWAGIVSEGARLFTTSYVLAECANAASRRPYRPSVEHLRTSLVADGGLIFPTSDEWDAACEQYTAGPPGLPGLVDEISFAVMRRLGLHRAFTNDAHFRTAGFEVLF